MPRWDLSKLPEGRKPLPDEWFAERAQMQERIKELEADLAKAVEALLETNAAFAKTVGLRRHKAWATINKTNRLLAELAGGNDE